MAAIPDPYSFNDYLHYTRSELRARLTEVVAALCTQYERVAFLKSTEGRGPETIENQGHLDALNEEKWLIFNLLNLDE